jgi:hypothetical protein
VCIRFHMCINMNICILTCIHVHTYTYIHIYYIYIFTLFDFCCIGLYGFRYIIDNIQKRIIKDHKTENKIEKINQSKDIQKQIIQENDVYDKYELPYIDDLYKDTQTELNPLDIDNTLLTEIMAIKYSLIKKIIDYMILEKQCSGCKSQDGMSLYILIYIRMSLHIYVSKFIYIRIYTYIYIYIYIYIRMYILTYISINTHEISISSLLLLGLDHLWLGQAEIVSVRQQLIPKIEVAIKEIERLLVVVISMIEVIKINNIMEKSNNINTIDDESIAEMIREIWMKYENNGAPMMIGDE